MEKKNAEMSNQGSEEVVSYTGPQERGDTLGAGCNLTLKERIAILSRRDRMRKMKPTWYRMLIAIVVLGIVMSLAQTHRTRSIMEKVVQGTPVNDSEVQITFVGDISLGRGVETYAAARSYNSLYREARVLWQESSLVFANLECSIIRQNASYSEADKSELISASQTALKVSAENGLNVVSLANDHVADYGRKGVRHTIEALEKYGIGYAGAGANIDEAGDYHLLEADGVTVGFVSFSDVVPKRFAATEDNYGVAPASYSALYRNVMEAAKYSDFVVVYVHWGENDSITVTDEQRQIAHQLIDSGADVVIGTHPQVLQPIESYGDGVIFYSLGNFIYDTIQRDERNTVMVQLNVDQETGAAAFTLIPMHIVDFRPCVTESAIYVAQIHDDLLKELPENAYTVDASGRIQIALQLYTPGEKEPLPVETDETGEGAADITG